MLTGKHDHKPGRDGAPADGKTVIRLAAPDDAEALLAIYAPYVRDTAVTFEYAVPSPAEFRNRIVSTLRNYPYLVYEENGRIAGYCYAGAFHTREAYKHTAETSVYVADGAHGRGIGRALYEKLEEMLIRQNVYTLYACVTCAERYDGRLPDTSLRFHERMGYKRIGFHENCGYKFDSWYSVQWLEKRIAERPAHPEPFIPFSERTEA